MPIQIFKEHQFGAFHVAFRIGIQGADVTSYVTEDPITVRYSDRNGPNTLSFSLQNAYDNFVLTKENLGWDEETQTSNPKKGKWRGALLFGDQPHYSEMPKQIIYEYKQAMNLRTTNSTDSNSSKIFTYNFKPGTLVLNKNDPVRVFIHNPLKELLGEEEGEWIPFFTGFIDTKPVPTDYISGASTINISCSCIKKQLQLMRLTFTPIAAFKGAMINELLYDTSETNFYKDLICQNNTGTFQHPFTNKNFHDAISMLLLGNQNLPEGKQGNESRVGFLSRGKTFRGVNPVALNRSTYDEKTKVEIPNQIVSLHLEIKELQSKTASTSFLYEGVKEEARIFRRLNAAQKELQLLEVQESESTGNASLEKWEELLLFGDYHLTQHEPTALPYYTTKEITEIIARTVTYDKEFSPWAAKVHMLLPPADAEFTRLIDENVKDVRPQREWLQTRFDSILQLCNLIDFQWITTPMGDIVFEFPMYDFLPYDLGASWENCFIVDKFAVRDTIDTEAGDIISGLIVTAGIDTFVGKGTENVLEGHFNKIVVKSDILAGKYGAHSESWEAPIGRQAKKGIDMTNLRIAALIEFQRRLADIDKATLDFVYHPFLLPNRNIMWTKKKKLAWVTSVEYTINLFKDIQNSVDICYVRDYSIKKTNKGPVIEYTYIFGGAKMPLSYKDLNNASSIETYLKGNEGIHIMYEPSSTEKQKNIEDRIDEISADIREGR